MSTLENVAQLEADLAELEAAMRAARTGSSYSLGGETVTRQELDALDRERTRLVRRLTSARRVLEGARSPSVSIANFLR